MRKMLAIFVVAMLLVSGLVLTVGSPADSKRDDSSRYKEYGLGALFSQPEKDKVVDHIYPENGAPDVRANKNSGDSSVSSVDLSDYLPPVGNQGHQGSCVAWSMGYYHKGYEENKEHGWTGAEKNKTEHQLSPAFVYNHVNGGQDSGSYFSEAAQLIVDMGIPTMKEMPYNDSDYTTWPDTRTYYDALQYRASDYHWIYVGDDDGIDNLKQHLANGNTAVLGIYVWDNFFNINDYNNTYTVADRTGSNHGGHGVCVIGYDDNKETKDGTGAFKLVNSWGTDWGDNGFWWMSYEAVKDGDLLHPMSQQWVIYLDDKVDYHPKTVAEVQISHGHRGDIMKYGITLGNGTEDNPSWNHTFLRFDYIRGEVGDSNYQRYPFPSNTIVFDLTDGVDSLSSGGDDFFVAVNDTIDGTTGNLTYLEVHHLPDKSSTMSTEGKKSIPDNSDNLTALHVHLNDGGGFHAPIRIDSNRDFYELRGVFSGNGSTTNPYVIENYNIDAYGRGNAIYVGNTTAYFVIKNCALYNASYQLSPYNAGAGVTLYSVHNGVVSNNNASNNSFGIYLSSSSSNTISNNTANSNNWYGVSLYYSSSNTISNNTASNNWAGIHLASSSSDTITGNAMVDDGISIEGYYILQYWNTHTIDTTNTVNGKPVYYWKNRTGGTIPSGAGEVILANCTNVVVENQNVSEGTVGIELGFSNNNTISNNTASNNGYGIFLDSSSNNTISNNIASLDNWYGICLAFSNSNTISNNKASSNTEYGIYLTSSDESNTITGNTASNNRYGIWLGYSSNNTISNNSANSNNWDGIHLYDSKSNRIYHNNFIKNTRQAYDNTGTNFWNASYPTGGNYWSDYNGTDEYSGHNQNENGSDGIGDTPYTNIAGGTGAQDNYPLMHAVVLMELNLNTGWNFISIPWQRNAANITDILSDISWDRAMVYINDTWYTYNKNRDAKYNLGFPMVDNTIGIWVNCTSSGMLSHSTQDLGSTGISLHKGWNLVGYPSDNATRTVAEALSGISYDYVQAYDTTSAQMETLASTDIMEPGKAYWIYVTEDCTWTVEW